MKVFSTLFVKTFILFSLCVVRCLAVKKCWYIYIVCSIRHRTESIYPTGHFIDRLAAGAAARGRERTGRKGLTPPLQSTRVHNRLVSHLKLFCLILKAIVVLRRSNSPLIRRAIGIFRPEKKKTKYRASGGNTTAQLYDVMTARWRSWWSQPNGPIVRTSCSTLWLVELAELCSKRKWPTWIISNWPRKKWLR